MMRLSILCLAAALAAAAREAVTHQCGHDKYLDAVWGSSSSSSSSGGGNATHRLRHHHHHRRGGTPGAADYGSRLAPGRRLAAAAFAPLRITPIYPTLRAAATCPLRRA
jgi:hypothetical protein